MSILKDLQSEYRFGNAAGRLVFWNVGIFVVALLLGFVPGFDAVYACFALDGQVFFRPWTLLSYAFLHANFLHLLFNMITLMFASRVFSIYFSQKQFIGLYVLGAMFSGIVFSVMNLVFHDGNRLVGASAAITAVLVAATTYNPVLPLRFPLIGTVKIWHVTGLLVVLSIVGLRGENYGGELSHLAGAAFGFMYMKLLQSGTDMSRIVTVVVDFVADLFRPKKKQVFRKVHTNRRPVNAAATSKSRNQQQIDDILDKIGRSGYESLTQEEKEFLFRAGKE